MSRKKTRVRVMISLHSAYTMDSYKYPFRRHGYYVEMSYMDFKIVNGDALEWCQENVGNVPAIVTSIPDMSEVGMEETEYIPFLRQSAHHILNCITNTGYAIFIQTDRKKQGLIDKSYYISDEAIRVSGFRMMFHKISLTCFQLV